MPSEKFFVHKEDGSLVRLKGRLVRFLDEEPPTGSDKSAIRTALEVSPDAEGLVQADVGTDPNQLVLHQHLGDISYQSADSVSVGTLSADGKTTLTNDQDNALVVQTENKNPMYVNVVGAAPNYLFDVRDDGTSKFRVDGSGNLSLETGEYQSGNALVISADPNNDGSSSKIEFKVDGTARAEITNSGNLNILSGNLGFDSGYQTIQLSDNKNFALAVNEGTTPYLRFVTSNSAEKIEFYKNLYMSGNVEFGSGNGLDFSGTADGTGSSISELFSDYEQGSFTPVIGTSGGTINGSTHIHSARYTRIGNTVHIAMYISTDGLTDVSSASGYPRITGLPFAAAGSGHYGGVVATYSANWTKTPLGGYVSSSSTIIALTQRFSSITGQITTGAASDFNTSGGTKNDIILTGHYEAA